MWSHATSAVLYARRRVLLQGRVREQIAVRSQVSQVLRRDVPQDLSRVRPTRAPVWSSRDIRVRTRCERCQVFASSSEQAVIGVVVTYFHVDNRSCIFEVRARPNK